MKRHMLNSWAEFLDVCRSDCIEDIYEKPVITEINCVTKFHHKEMDMFGISPLWDKFSLVNCKICGFALKPQYLKMHMDRKHNCRKLAPIKDANPVLNINSTQSSWIIDDKSEKKGLKLLLTRQNDKGNYYNCRYSQSDGDQNRTSTVYEASQKTNCNASYKESLQSSKRIAAQSSLPCYSSNISMPPIFSDRSTLNKTEFFADTGKPKKCFNTKDNHSILSREQSKLYDLYPRDSSVCAFKMKRTDSGLVLCSKSPDSVRETYIKIIGPRKRKSRRSLSINKSTIPDSSTSSSDSMSSFMKAGPLLMPKLSDMYYQCNSHISSTKEKLLTKHPPLTKIDVLNKSLSEEIISQNMKSPVISSKIPRQLKDICHPFSMLQI